MSELAGSSLELSWLGCPVAGAQAQRFIAIVPGFRQVQSRRSWRCSPRGG